MSLTTADTSTPAADATDAPSTSETSSRRVSIASGTAPATGRSRTAAKATRTTGRPHSTAASSRKKCPRPRQRHMVYGIKLSEEGMRAFSDEHFGPPPEGLTEEDYQSWWSKRRGSLFAIIPRHCINRLPARCESGPGNHHPRWGLTQTGSAVRRQLLSSHQCAPSPQLVADVAKYMHQGGDKPQWYRFAKTGD